ncbi:MAG: CotH kinase family protein [Candidatus Sabulitectum sp.]|nr:CotH kinase family protein [Candidatus Sabulitectum sp.]
MQTVIAFLLCVPIIGEGTTRPEGWTDISHSNTADPDFELVFPQDSVNRIDIIINPADWQIMMDDMTELFGEFGETAPYSNSRPPQPPGISGVPFHPGPERGFPPGMNGPGLPLGSNRNPVWVQSTIIFDGVEWLHAGIRFKGNSSLIHTWEEGILKLPIKLDFDQFEEEFPEINNQRFFGFRQLTLSSNFMDCSLLREKVTADIFRAAGVPAPHTAFYRVFVDFGEGSVYFGLYTMVEVVDDTVIKEQFQDYNGNVYKPEGRGATFAEGSFVEEAFDRKNNATEEDWSDILLLFDILHSDQRLCDPVNWRSELESIFDVEGFLLWLAVNVTVQNWDTYGRSPHNYYLYSNPATGLLIWIPWDNNMALRDDAGLMPVLTLDLEDVGSEWPLIRYLLDVPDYRMKYLENLEIAIETAFEAEGVSERYRDLQNLISPYVNAEIHGYTLLSNPDEFNEAIDELVAHVFRRNLEVETFLRRNR